MRPAIRLAVHRIASGICELSGPRQWSPARASDYGAGYARRSRRHRDGRQTPRVWRRHSPAKDSSRHP
ncbi:hypothetical protein UP10_00950 [Bradyrhizobium sp. LTSPM299]|nr:hypothetical protein UP10_00950 [Bradyrhizobium sp. LTSPM299]